MRVSLSEVMNLNGGIREVDAEFGDNSFSYDGSDYGFITRSPVHMRFSKLSPKTVRFRVQFSCVLSAECSRCLEAVELPIEIDTELELVVDGEGGACTADDDEKLSYVESYELDVDGFIREELMIGFPLQVLCSDDCKGLCPVCGKNLNKGECGCDRFVPDPRMSAIRDLFPDL